GLRRAPDLQGNRHGRGCIGPDLDTALLKVAESLRVHGDAVKAHRHKREDVAAVIGRGCIPRKTSIEIGCDDFGAHYGRSTRIGNCTSNSSSRLLGPNSEVKYTQESEKPKTYLQ